MVFLHIDTQYYNKKGETGETPIETLNKFSFRKSKFI